VVSAATFWALLLFLLAVAIILGVGRHGWREVRHEMRKRKSL